MIITRNRALRLGLAFIVLAAPTAAFSFSAIETEASALPAEIGSEGAATTIDVAQDRGPNAPRLGEAEMRGAQGVFASAREIQAAAGAAARSALEARWGRGTILIPPGPGNPDEIRICLGRFGCWNIKITINIQSAD